MLYAVSNGGLLKRPFFRSSCAAPPTGEATIWFDMINTRGFPTEDYVQIADIVLLDCNGKPIPIVQGSAKNLRGGISYGNEQPMKAFDGNIQTKWLGRSNHVGLEWKIAGKLSDIKSYYYVTANDHSRRDPAMWVLKGNECGCKWEVLHNAFEKTPYAAPTARYVETTAWTTAIDSCEAAKPKTCSPTAGRCSPGAARERAGARARVGGMHAPTHPRCRQTPGPRGRGVGPCRPPKVAAWRPTGSASPRPGARSPHSLRAPACAQCLPRPPCRVLVLHGRRPLGHGRLGRVLQEDHGR